MNLNKKIIITGAAGFIGTNFTERALGLGYQIVVIDSLTYSGISENITRFSGTSNYTIHKNDILDTKNIENIIKNFKPDYIINFAAESHVDRSIDNPKSFAETNTMGTINLLECIRKFKKYNDTIFIQISTDEVYGDIVDGEAKELSKYNPNSPYSASKAAADLFIQAWNKTFDIKSIILHPSNNYGPRQFPEKLIPLTIINALEGEKIPIYGDGEQSREWIYVEDTVEAILSILEKKDFYGHLNIGSGIRISNLELVKKICSILNNLHPSNNTKYENLISFTEDRPGHDKRYAINSENAKLNMNWSSKIDIDTGLQKTVQWYLNNKNWWTSIRKSIYDGVRLGLTK